MISKKLHNNHGLASETIAKLRTEAEAHARDAQVAMSRARAAEADASALRASLRDVTARGARVEALEASALALDASMFEAETARIDLVTLLRKETDRSFDLAAQMERGQGTLAELMRIKEAQGARITSLENSLLATGSERTRHEVEVARLTRENEV